MTCTTCGRENPPHLTFCQECGQRLGPRIAPPTPPIGLGVEPDMADARPPRVQTALGAGPPPAPGHAKLGATALVPNSPAARLDATIANDRPPDFGLHLPPAVAAQAPAVAGGPRRCRICDTANGPNLRYCTSCGSTLDAPGAVPSPAPAGGTLQQPAAPRLIEPAPVAVPVPVQAQGGPIAPAPAPFGGAPAPIAPMRVVELGGAARGEGAPQQRTCTRCRGVVDGNAQFCKFCGAPLGEIPRDASAAPSPPGNAGAYAPNAGAYAPPPAPAHAPAANVAPVQVLSPAPAAPYGAPPPPQQAPQASYAPAPPPAAPQPQANATPAHVPSHAQPQLASHAPTPPPPAAAPPPLAAPPLPARRPGSIPPPLPGQALSPVDRPTNGPPAGRGSSPSYAPPPAQPPPAVGPAPNPNGASAPAPAVKVTRGRLVVIAKSGADGPSYPIGDTMDVGRQEGQVIVAEDPYLSPRHVRIAWRNERFYLRDLGSTNGVFLRLVAARDASSKAKRADDASGEVTVPLQDQDLILVGQQVLRFELVKDGEAGFGPATEHGTLLFGSPAAPRYARLGQRTVEGVTRDVYYVRKMETVLGRESGDVVFTEDPFLSRRHAAVRVLGPNGQPIASGTKPPPHDQLSFALVDLGSSNGTFLKIRNEVELVPGDHFRVGQQLFRVDWDAQPSAASR